jgi:hypothetical protein
MTDQNDLTPGSAPDAPTQAWTPPPAAPVAPATSPPPPVVPTPVQATSAPTPSAGRGPLRWAAAIAVVTLVLGATLAVAALLTGGTTQASVLRYVPQDTVVYGELRLDLPGDQRQAVAEFLSNFPGFADQAALESKLDETLDRLLADATDGSQSYTADIKPWFDGEVAFSVGPIPADALSGGAPAATAPRALLLISIKDATAASAWFGALLAEGGIQTTTETYQGVQVTVVSAGAEVFAQEFGAFAILGGNVAVLGDLASVKAAIDTGGTQSLASDPEFEAATASTEGDYIGFAYVDMQALIESALDASDAIGTDLPVVSDTLTDLLPAWTAYQLRAESDALVAVATNPHVDRGFGATTNRVNEVVDHVPSTAIALVAGNEVGATWQGAFEKLGDEASLKETFDAIESATGLLGGMDGVIGWIGDAGFVVNQTGSELEGGFVIVPTDPAKAEDLFGTLKTFISLGGGSMGLSVRDEDYGDATITIVSVDLESLSGLAGGVSGGATDALPLEGTFELSFAATDDVVVIGSGPGFVKHVLDTDAGTSLASDAAYDDAVGRLGSDAVGVTFVDIESVRTLLEATLTGDELARYTTDVKPFLEPFVAFATTSTVGGAYDTFQSVITVK